MLFLFFLNHKIFSNKRTENVAQKQLAYIVRFGGSIPSIPPEKQGGEVGISPRNHFCSQGCNFPPQPNTSFKKAFKARSKWDMTLPTKPCVCTYGRCHPTLQRQLNTSMNLTGLEKSLKSSVRMTEGQHLGTSLGSVETGSGETRSVGWGEQAGTCGHPCACLPCAGFMQPLESDASSWTCF